MRIFITDCEGPISKNDNAMELTAHFVPQGEAFFSLLSRYDDYLAYVEQRPGYEAGDTLRLILPFLKAFGATDQGIEEYSRGHILLMPGAEKTLSMISQWMPTFIISTSYEPYIKALCEAIGFPLANAYCTRLTLNRYTLPPEEKRYLERAAAQISRMPMIEWREGARGFNDLTSQAQEVVQRLNRLFWEEMIAMEIGRVLEEIEPLGAEGKAAALNEALERTGAQISGVLYVGDSITDLQALRMVRAGGGLAVSFNGNAYAIQAAQVACLGEDTGIITIVARLFVAGGRDAALSSVAQWGEETLREAGIEEGLLCHLAGIEIGEITPDNQTVWAQKSQRLRRQVRGIRIGSLG